MLERMAISAFEGVIKEADNLIQEAKKEYTKAVEPNPEPIKVEVVSSIPNQYASFKCLICHSSRPAKYMSTKGNVCIDCLTP